MPDAGTRTAPDYLVVVFPRSARGSCAGDGALALASLSGDLTLPACDRRDTPSRSRPFRQVAETSLHNGTYAGSNCQNFSADSR